MGLVFTSLMNCVSYRLQYTSVVALFTNGDYQKRMELELERLQILRFFNHSFLLPVGLAALPALALCAPVFMAPSHLK
jgi:hypothetical protein